MKRIIFVSLFVLILNFGAAAQANEFEIGLKLAQRGDFQNALPHFQNSLDKKLPAKRLAQIHYNTGVCYYRLKQTNAAITELTKAVSLNPKYEKALYALGMAHTDLMNWGDAETAFRQAIRVSKIQNGEIWFDLALVLTNLEKHEDAINAFQKAINLGSIANAASHNNLGVIYAWKGDLKAAQKEIELSKTLGFAEAEGNLEIVRKALNSNDKTLIGKLILKER